MIPLQVSVPARRSVGFRPAFTLIEMVVMMSIFTAASVSAISILSHLSTISKKTTDHCLMIREVHRLVEQFRDEVHRCESATTESDGEQLVLQFTDGSRSEFELSALGVSYRHLAGKSDAPNSIDTMVVHDLFSIAPNDEWRFTVNDEDAMASLLLRPEIGSRAPSLSEKGSQWQIDAAIAIEKREVATRDEK